jgi:hypothetical protein
VVTADTPHAFEASGLVALLFIQPESRAGRSLMHLMEGKPAVPISAEQARDAPELIQRAFEQAAGLFPRLTIANNGVWHRGAET